MKQLSHPVFRHDANLSVCGPTNLPALSNSRSRNIHSFVKSKSARNSCGAGSDAGKRLLELVLAAAACDIRAAAQGAARATPGFLSSMQ